jgi:alpha-amylase/alpha-mannosidase (GH57 family)
MKGENMERFVCIHGHFYQPPRENPWLEAIEIQDSAHPYHDWNERIAIECYAPNSASRIVNGEQRIIDIVSNYSQISFNFGPTLLSWMEKFNPEAYAAVLEADRVSMERRSGHGNALAQGYNHMILPLANSRDKRTQIVWGLKDFQARFRRFPEGMWLPETAVDLETLDLLAEQGVKFTILAPNQARRVRDVDNGTWTDVSGSRIDPTRPYLCRLPSGRELALFFYDGPISQAVAFERLLSRGENFASRLMSGFNDGRQWAQLLHIATDGETYGHHQSHADMGLAFTLRYIEERKLARLTNYGTHLELFPPTHEVEIIENSSWSCVHGIERWRANCGCNSGGHEGWSQAWRAPLRRTLDWLRDELSGLYANKAGEYLLDPWQARDDFIEVVLDRRRESVSSWFDRHSRRPLDSEDRIIVMKLLELQRHAMLMYTSCGWFFDDLGGIETTQVMQYAGRAMQLARDCLGVDLESAFLERLASARSNVPEVGDGKEIYERYVKPSIVDLRKVAAHYSIRSLFEDCEGPSRIYSYVVTCGEHEKQEAGMARLALGKVSIASDITVESETVSFCVLHLGEHALNCGVCAFPGEEAHNAMKHAMRSAFEKGDFAEILRGLDRYFGPRTYSIKDLFRDDQRIILRRIMSEVLEHFENTYRNIYENSRGLMGLLQETGMPVPRGFSSAAEFVLNLDLKRAFWAKEVNADVVRGIMFNVRRWQTPLDAVDVEYTLRRRVNALMKTVRENPLRTDELATLINMLEILHTVPIEPNLWQAQNNYHKIAAAFYHDMREKSSAGHAAAAEWITLFQDLGRLLFFDTNTALTLKGPEKPQTLKVSV